MAGRFAVTVERDGPGYVSTSPDHPSAAGRGRTPGESLADLGRQIDAQAALGHGPASPAPPHSAEPDETACADDPFSLHSSQTRANRASTDGVATMRDTSGSRSPYYVRSDVRPVPGALEWLEEHWNEYAGRWVAIGPAGLVAAGATFDEMRRQVESLRGLLVAQVV